MKKIIFLRPSPYSDLLEGKGIISSFDSIGLQKSDPVIGNNIKIDKRINFLMNKFKPKAIYTSPALRCVQTAMLFKMPYKVFGELNEIKFSLTGTISPSFLNKDNLDINQLREELVKAFVNNKTEENPTETLIRINNFFKLIQNVDGNIICISHAFIMKFYEIFFRSNCNVKSINYFRDRYNWKIKPYEFLEGFYIILDTKGNIHKINLIKY